ncbi:MAG: hypothetical protein PUP90_15670 [Nostoc sp. S4]|nr:hypothetical protein [Nostoc sp. S4]
MLLIWAIAKAVFAFMRVWISYLEAYLKCFNEKFTDKRKLKNPQQILVLAEE